jgi:uncharacterized protein YcbX
MMRVAALFAYPVKSCAAVALQAAALDVLGIEQDRRFAFVDARGRALTQRELPLLATIRPALEGEALRLDLGGLAQLVLRPQDFAAGLEVDVWGKRVPARAAREAAVSAVADYLGAPLRLAALERESQRAFVDSQPVLVATAHSLGRLNAALARPVGMERFRANVVVEGGAESWQALHAEQVTLERTKACGRCEMTTIDQASGARRGEEPLRTLTERFEGNFGLYCRVSRPGRLRVGDALREA